MTIPKAHTTPTEAPTNGGDEKSHWIQALQSEDAQRELRQWCLHGVAALAIAGVFALMLALSRVPGSADLVPWPLDFFNKGLVIHVVFSFVVWFLAMLGALATIATYVAADGVCKARGVGKTALQLVLLAQIALFVPAFRDGSQATLNNYVPVIIDPVYYTGLFFLFLGLLAAVMRATFVIYANKNRARGPVAGVGLTAGGYLIALMSLVLALNNLFGQPAGYDLNENLFWGMGHLLQFVNVGLMAIAWYWLASQATGTESLSPHALAGSTAFLLAAALLGVAGFWIYTPFDADYVQFYTNVQYLLAPVPVILTALLGLAWLKAGRPGMPTTPERRLAIHALGLSIGVFMVGGLLGLQVDGADTRTPAHYHGVIGGVNLSLMGLFFVLFLPALNRAKTIGKSLFLLLWFYGLGQLLHSLGLFFAGGYGAPRKVAGDVPGLEALGAQIALYAMGVGAVIAVAGGVMFIWMTGMRLIKKPVGVEAAHDV